MPSISNLRLHQLEKAERDLKTATYQKAAVEAAEEIKKLSGLLLAQRAVELKLTDQDKLLLREVRHRCPTSFHAWAELANPKLNELGALS